MKFFLLKLASALALPALLLVGCGGDDTKTPDGGSTLDMNVSTLDMTASTGCTTVATWPNDTTYSFLTLNPYDGFDAETDVYGDRTVGTLVDSLGVQIYIPSGSTPSYPKPIAIAANGTYNDCNDCVVAYVGQTASSNGTLYFAQGGSITITQADRNPNGGDIKVSGSKIHLVEWNTTNDAPVANAKCMDVGAFDFKSTYDAVSTDGGTDM